MWVCVCVCRDKHIYIFMCAFSLSSMPSNHRSQAVHTRRMRMMAIEQRLGDHIETWLGGACVAMQACDVAGTEFTQKYDMLKRQMPDKSTLLPDACKRVFASYYRYMRELAWVKSGHHRISWFLLRWYAASKSSARCRMMVELYFADRVIESGNLGKDFKMRTAMTADMWDEKEKAVRRNKTMLPKARHRKIIA